jgi:glycerophosphoryl diester phosphodiesterase
MANAYRYPCRIIAHRAGGTLAPENTLAAIREGHARGYHGVEFDVMLARGDVPVLMHDDTLERTTNGHGGVAEQDAASLGRLDAGAWFAPRFAGEPVPLLAAAARLCRELQLFANVEIKPYAPGGITVARTTGHITALAVREFWHDTAPPLLSSFAPDALAAAREAAPELPRALLFDAVPENWQAQLRGLDCVALHCNSKKLDAATARAVKDAGYGLMCWTVNRLEEADLIFGWGVDALCTDRLDLFTPA